jgi:hypothetical protein
VQHPSSSRFIPEMGAIPGVLAHKEAPYHGYHNTDDSLMERTKSHQMQGEWEALSAACARIRSNGDWLQNPANFPARCMFDRTARDVEQ